MAVPRGPPARAQLPPQCHASLAQKAAHTFEMPVPTSNPGWQNHLEIALYIDGNTQSMESFRASASETLGASGSDHAALAGRGGNSDDNKRCILLTREVVPSDLSTNASNPAANAAFLKQGLVKAVNMTIGVAGTNFFNIRPAEIPFRRGIAKSITIRSG